MLYFFTFRGLRYSLKTRDPDEFGDCPTIYAALRLACGERALIECRGDFSYVKDRCAATVSFTNNQLKFKKTGVIATLRTIVYGGFDERAVYDKALEIIPIPEARWNFDQFWHDRFDHPKLVERARDIAAFLERAKDNVVYDGLCVKNEEGNVCQSG